MNTTAQGHPVPVGYGRLMVGGGLVSAGVSIDQIMAGYRRVRTNKTTTKQYYDLGGTLFLLDGPLPANVYRKSLIAYDPEGYTNGVLVRPLYTYRIYYYEITQELIT